MDFRRRQFLGWGVLALFALLGGAWLAQLDYSRKISTDALDLIPSQNLAPELALVRSLASQAEARTMLIELTRAGAAPVPADTATHFAEVLARDPAFAQALAMSDTRSRDGMGKQLFDQRFTLLFPRWLHDREAAYQATGGKPEDFSTWLVDDAVRALGNFLNTPEALAFQEIVPADPLLLMSGAVERLKGGLDLVQPATKPSGPAPALVWAELANSPLSDAGQTPAFAAIDRAVAALQSEAPGLKAAYSGVNRFAAASRERIEREVKWLNTASLIAVLLVALAFIRQVYRGLHLVPIVLLSVLGAWVAVTLAFDRVQMLVFVVGSLLTGVAIDYGFYLFMQRPARVGEDYWEKVRRLAKPLLASCLTTVAGFALLLFSDLPLIRQLGLFVGAGLLSALAVAVIYFSTVRDPFLEARLVQGGSALPAPVRHGIRYLLIAAWIAALPGLFRLQWRDDIRDLEIPSPEVKLEAARIQALFGQRESQTVFLTYGDSPRAARDSLEKLQGWLDQETKGRAQSISLGAVVPTETEFARAQRFATEHADFPEHLKAALASGGFDEAEFAPFFSAYAQATARLASGDLAAEMRAFQEKLTGPTGMLVHIGEPLSWFVTLVQGAPPGLPPPELHTTSTSQLQSLNRVFGDYRRSALHLSLIGLAIVGAGVFVTYGWRDGLRIFAIPCGACLGLFGWLGWLGLPLNLFHLLGAFLGVCLTHNYSIFSATSAYRRELPPVSVRVSALTTAASFGVLALSGIPVVRALGVTVAAMVVVALLAIEFEHLSALGRSPDKAAADGRR